MPKRITVTCPKQEDRRYFSEKIHRYSNRLNVYYNEKMLIPNINDAEEYLPLMFERFIEYDKNAINRFRFEYNIQIDTAKEYADVLLQLQPDSKCKIFIARKNYVEGSELLDSNYKVDFSVNGEVKTFDKGYHEGNTNQILFEYDYDYAYPLEIKRESRKSFYNDKITYDEIGFRLDEV